MIEMKASTGRVSIMALIFGTTLTSFLVLFGMGAHAETIDKAFPVLLQFYLPLISVMGAFYFSQGISNSKAKTQTEIFIFIFAVTGIWTLAPIFLMFFAGANSLPELWPNVKIYGETTVIAAVTYFFARTGDKQSASVD